MIKQTYLKLLELYKVDMGTSKNLWGEIEECHSGNKRHYHNLNHLNELLHHLEAVKDSIKNWDIILFTLFYHDIVYNASSSKNEEESAQLAAKRMKEIGVSHDAIQLCQSQILATKKHAKSTDSDTNYFLDADLAILGATSERYQEYCTQVRREYAIYPNFLYKRGRKRVVQHFLAMERIYKTEEFYDRYESQAKLNLREELKRL